MLDTHFAHWPPEVPRQLALPDSHLYANVERSAHRVPDKPFLIFYDNAISFARFQAESEKLAGYLQRVCGVQKGDRVLLYMQNSPQFALGYYAILRADAVVVPVNPMNMTQELEHLVADSQARVALVSQELYPQIRPLMAGVAGAATDQAGLSHVVVATYSDYLEQPTDLRIPAFVCEPRRPLRDLGAIAWHEALAMDCRPGPMQAGPGDLAVLPYTSGTTAHPKGCMHTHGTVMYNAVARSVWLNHSPDTVYLSVLPFFHVTGMQVGLNGPLYQGATTVILARWDREVALHCIERFQVTATQMISTMVMDVLACPTLDRFKLSSLSSIGGGGAAMPEAVADQLKQLLQLSYVEGYGMSETMAATHINPPHRPMRQCLGIPLFDVDARVVDPISLRSLPAGEVGEIIVHGPQVMIGYWRNPKADQDSFVHLDGKRFLKTGDLARTDEHGYFFMVDRLKRMINASGYKVWPTEVEAMMYRHPDIQEVCVIAARDSRRGETVKALVVLKQDKQGRVTEQDVIDWASTQMATYKSPRIVQFVSSLPRSGTGKIQWRQLQEQEYALSSMAG